MTPAALEFYGADLPAVISAHVYHGYIFSGPGFLCMGKAAPAGADPELLRDPWHEFEPAACNAWWLHWIEGEPAAMLKFFPHPMPWVLYERRGQIRRRRWDRLIVRGFTSLSPPASPG